MSLLHGLRSLGEEGLTHLTTPILSVYSRTPSSFQLSNMSSPMVKRTNLFLTAYVHFAPFTSSTFTSLMPTSSHPLALLMSSLASSLFSLFPPSPRTGARRGVSNDIRRYAMRLRTFQDPHRCLCPELQRRLACLRYERVLLKSIRGVQSPKPFSTVLCKCILVLASAQLADSFILLKVRTATGGRLY